METTEKVQKAKIRLLQRHPFYATLVFNLTMQPDPSIDTANTDGAYIRYAPAFFEAITIEEIAGVLAHEVLHITLLHHCRIGGRDRVRWNVACDYAINPLLIKAGLTLPEGALIDPRYAGHSAEHIYPLLPPPPPDKQPAAGMGDITPPPPDQSTTQQELRVKQLVQQASQAARLRGQFPADLDRWVRQALEPKIDWQTALAQYLTDITQDDYCWSKPATRYLHCHLFLPCRELITYHPLILIVDTSMSIDERLLHQFAGEVQGITRTFNVSLQVIYVDAQFQSIEDIDPDEPIQLHPKGGGGTSFRPGFEYIEQAQLTPKAVVYLTDGECSRYPEAPDYPVIWAQFSCLDFQPPFGEVIKVV
jgi:predicted metal-dependent peptidase